MKLSLSIPNLHSTKGDKTFSKTISASNLTEGHVLYFKAAVAINVDPDQVVPFVHTFTDFQKSLQSGIVQVSYIETNVFCPIHEKGNCSNVCNSTEL